MRWRRFWVFIVGLLLINIIVSSIIQSAGQPASVAPLAWTDAVTLLALLAQAGHLPTVPVPPPAEVP